MFSGVAFANFTNVMMYSALALKLKANGCFWLFGFFGWLSLVRFIQLKSGALDAHLAADTLGLLFCFEFYTLDVEERAVKLGLGELQETFT